MKKGRKLIIGTEIQELVETIARSPLQYLSSIAKFFESPFRFRKDGITLSIDFLPYARITVDSPKGAFVCQPPLRYSFFVLSMHAFDLNYLVSQNEPMIWGGRQRDIAKDIQELKKALEQGDLIFSSHFSCPVPFEEGIRVLLSCVNRMEDLLRLLGSSLMHLLPFLLDILVSGDCYSFQSSVEPLGFYVVKVGEGEYAVSIGGFLTHDTELVSFLKCDGPVSFSCSSSWSFTEPQLRGAHKFMDFRGFLRGYEKLTLLEEELRKGTFRVLTLRRW